VQMQLKYLFLFGALFLIPLGTGGIKPNICNFGADQIGDETPEQQELQKSYFSYFYLAVNVGAGVSFGYIINVCTSGEPLLGVSLEQGYTFAYLFGASAMALAVVMFVCSRNFFKRAPGGGVDSFMTMVETVAYSVGPGASWRAWSCALGWILLPFFFVFTMASSLMSKSPAAAEASSTYSFPNEFEKQCGAPEDWQGSLLSAMSVAANATAEVLEAEVSGGKSTAEVLNQIAFIIGAVSCLCLVLAHLNNSWIRPLPKERLGSRDFAIEDVRAGFACIPLIIIANLAFSIPYNATNNALPSQACQMDTRIGGKQLNGAFFTLAGIVAIIVFTPIFETFLFPLVSKLKGSPVRLGQKLITGLLVAAAANAVAAYFEIQRRKAPMLCSAGVSLCAPNGIHMREGSAFWLYIPIGMIGIAEILVNPVMYCFSYSAAPPKVRSLIQAFNLIFQGGVSNAFTAVAIKATFPDDLDSGNLEYYYFTNVVCAFIGVMVYFLVTRCGSNGGDLKDSIEEELDVLEHTTTKRSEPIA